MSDAPDHNQEQTHFGFKSVPTAEKAQHVRAVFDSVADKYDVMNDLMSMGVHRVWKRYTIDLAAARRGEQVLDVAAGTADLSMAFARLVGKDGQVTVSDINAAMLRNGRDRLMDAGIVDNVRFVQANAECLPFADNQFDLITIAFGLRNVTDKAKALRCMLRILKPGGRLLVLEFSKPVLPLLNSFYDQYSFKLLPKIGQLVAGDASSYQYLAESIRMHPPQEELKAMMQEAGFERCQYFNLTGGIVAVHRGYKL